MCPALCVPRLVCAPPSVTRTRYLDDSLLIEKDCGVLLGMDNLGEIEKCGLTLSKGVLVVGELACLV